MTTTTMTTMPPPTTTAAPPSSPAPSSLRYIPQGLASLSSDAPGWSYSSSSSSSSSASEVAGGESGSSRGPICWKCRGMRFLATAQAVSAPSRAKSQQQQQQQQHDKESAAAIAIDESNNSGSTTSRRSCPICAGLGHLPIKLKYRQSMTEMTGAITPRRRGHTSRKLGWVESGHVPGAVWAVLHCRNSNNNSNNTITINTNGDEDDHDTVTPTSYHDNDGAMMRYAIDLLSQACRLDDDSDHHDKNSNNVKRKDIPVSASMARAWKRGGGGGGGQSPAAWLPTNPGEQLCNLVGYWRILQRKASHRWTTDDVVTAHVAASTFVSSLFTRVCDDDDDSNNSTIDAQDGENNTIRYLDLGTGNASVLQMVTWYLLSSSTSSRGCKNRKKRSLKAAGVEARSEAVDLARRSLSFNLRSVEFEDKMYCGGVYGDNDNGGDKAMLVDSKECNVQIVQGDFRDLVSLAADSSTKRVSNEDDDGQWSMEGVASKRYDLITGTPPYFRVGFTTSKSQQGKGAERTTDDDCEEITSAVIEQGGMPTSMQSAPARCEFRGGIETYCLAASALLSVPHGIFVVCENWANDDRVWKGAAEAGLTIQCVWPVNGGGKQRQGTILFAVYVMMKKKIEDEAPAVDDCKTFVDEPYARKNCIQPTLVVRDKNGKWTQKYAHVMHAMSIPTE